MAVSLVGSIGASAVVTSGLVVTGAYGQSPTANNLLVAVVEITGQSAITFAISSSSSGWSRLVPDTGDNASGVGTSWSGVSIWVKQAVGGDSLPVFSYGTQIGWGKVYILELANANVATPLDTYGHYCQGNYNTVNSEICTTTGNVTASGEYAICVTATSYNSGSTHTPISGFTNKFVDSGGAPNYFALDIQAGPTAGSPAGGTDTWTNSSTWVISLPVIAVASGGSVPSAPTGLTVTGTTTTNVSLSWTAPTGSVSGYYIYQGGVQVGTTTGTTYTVTGLAPNTAYTFKVAAYNANGTGAQTSGVVGTTVAIGGGGSVTAPLVLPGNILTVADSDFESGSNTWAAYSGANAPSVVTTYSFSGGQSLKWTANSTNDTFVATGYYPCTGNNGYDVSGYVITPSAAHDTYIGVNFYTSSHTFINTVWGNDNPSAINVWQPLVANVTSPSNAAYMEITVWIGTFVTNSEPFAIDLLYVTDTEASVWVDWTNPVFISSSSAGTDFMDMTPWIRFEQNINMSHGRQDAVSEIQSGQSTFYVQNDTGWFTPQKSGSPYFPNISLGARCQINAIDEIGTWFTRFDGAISEITYDADMTGGTNLSQFSVSDVFAYLNRQDPLSCWTKERILADNPWLHWTMSDAGTSNLCAETSGNNGPSLRAIYYGGTMTWGSTSQGVETLSNAAAPNVYTDAAYWNAGTVIPITPTRGLAAGVVGPTSAPIGSVAITPTLSAQGAQNAFIGTEGYQFTAQLNVGGVPAPLVTSTNNYTIEAYFCMGTSIASSAGKDLGPFTVVSLGSSRQSQCLNAGVYISGSNFVFDVSTYAQPPSFAYSAFSQLPTTLQAESAPISSAPNVPHHLVMEIVAGSPATLNAWVDNVQTVSIPLPAGQVYDTICVGGAYGGHGNFSGSISCVSIYQSLLSNTQITNHCAVGQYGFWEQTTDNCIAELGTYAGLPTFWKNLNAQWNGLTMTDYYSIVGTTPLSSMQVYEQAEHGLLYVNMEGQLTFHTRDWRMGYNAPDVSVPSSVYNPDLGYELVDTYLLNEAATSTTVFTEGVDWVSVSSQNSFGAYANGTTSSPIQLPLITWSREWEQAGITANEYWADPNLNDNASWQVNTRSNPRLIPGSFTVDLLTIEPSSFINGLTITSFYQLDTDNMITVTGLPAGNFPDQTGVFDYFIEGVNEVIGLSERSITFYTSPASIQRAWAPGDPVYGQLGITSRLGISAPDTSPTVPLGKSVSHDGGPPYWPPAFQTFPGGTQIGYQNGTATNPVINVNVASNQGDCILVVVQAPSAATITVADNLNSGNYTLLGSVSNTGFVQYLFAYFNALPLNPATATITVTTSASQNYTTSAFRIWGVSSVDVAANTNTGSSTTASITGTGPMANANDFELVVMANANTESVTVIPSGWTQLWLDANGVYQNQLFWRQASSTTSDSFSGALSGSSTPWGCIAVSFVVNTFYMNNPSANGHDFIGSRDMRGIRDNLAMALNPPMCIAAQQNNAQSYASGVQTASRVLWDQIFVDTVGGMGSIAGYPNWYCVQVPGVYEICGSILWQSQSTGAAGQRTGWIIIARNAAALIAAGTGNPQSGDTYVCPIGETVNPANASGFGPVCNPSTRIYLGVGDMVGLGAEHTQGSAITTGTGEGGSMMSIRWLGYGTINDQQPTVNAPSSAGVVNGTPPAKTSTYTKAYRATGTYSYYGSASTWGQPKNHNGLMYQGWYAGASNTGSGSECSFILFNGATIASDTSGANINWCHLIIQNQHFWYDSGGNLIVGWTSNSSWGGAFPSGATLHPDYSQPYMPYGSTKTLSISATIGRAFQSSGATAIMLGNNSTENLDYYGIFTGGTSPQLVINYTK